MPLKLAKLLETKHIWNDIFKHMVVNETLMTEMRAQPKHVVVTHGALLRPPTILPPLRKTGFNKGTNDPLRLMFGYMRKWNLRVVDLFNSCDRSRIDNISRDEIRKAYTVNIKFNFITVF